MRKKLGNRSPHKRIEIEEIAERAESGEDVSAYFTRQHRAKQRVNVDFPLILLPQIDAECQRPGATRQAWIEMACDERIRQTESGPRQRRAFDPFPQIYRLKPCGEPKPKSDHTI